MGSDKGAGGWRGDLLVGVELSHAMVSTGMQKYQPIQEVRAHVGTISGPSSSGVVPEHALVLSCSALGTVNLSLGH